MQSDIQLRKRLSPVPRAFATRMETLHGERGRRWIEGLPALLQQIASAWEIEIGSPMDGLSYNYVASARDSGGRACVVKLGLGSEEGDRESLALVAYDGRGAVRLLQHDAWHAMLLERIEPGESLLGLGDEQAVGIASEVLARLWEASSTLPGVCDPRLPSTPTGSGLSVENPQEEGRVATGFPDLNTWTRSLAHFAAEPGPLPGPLVERAAALRRELLTDPPDSVLLHGDLHHTNVLRSEARGWLAIDPKGVVGERAYDVIQFLFNPGPVPVETTHRRIDGFVERLGLDRKRVVAWALVQSVVSACWTVEDGDTGWEGAIRFAKGMN